MKKYGISFEVSGELGMFPDIQTGSNPFSTVIPPPTACSGMIRSIVEIVGTNIDIVAIGVCHQVDFVDYSYNSHTPLKVTGGENAMQIMATALVRPTYSILATLSNDPSRRHPKHLDKNQAHAMQSIFNRRLKKGQSFFPVCLGWREMRASYVGPIKTPVNKDLDCVISLLPYEIVRGNGTTPTSCKAYSNVAVKAGVAHLDQTVGIIIKDDGCLSFHPQTAIAMK